MGVQTAQKSFL